MEFIVNSIALHAELKRDPFELHVFTFPSDAYTVIDNNTLHDRIVVKYNSKTAVGLSVYVYSYILNSEGTPIRTVSAVAHVFFDEFYLLEGAKTGVPFMNSVLGEQVGALGFSYKFTKKPQLVNKVGLAQLFLAIANSTKHKCFDRFDSMKPLDPYISRVHAPYFKTHFGGKLPGWTFWLNSDKLRVSEAFYKNMMQSVLWRFSLRDLKTAHDEDVAALFFTGVANVIQSYDYIADTTYSIAKKKRVPCESFDCYLVRHGGDCEDSSLAMVKLVRSFQVMKVRSAMLQRVQRVLAQYMVFSTLGMVSNYSAANWNQNSARQKMAHMSVYAISKHRVFNMILRCKKNTDEQLAVAQKLLKNNTFKHSLPTFRLEGTAPTLPITYDACIIHTLKRADKKKYKKIPYVNLPTFSEPLSIKKSHPFYKIDSHLYTDEMLTTFKAGAATFVSTKRNKLWGKSFADVMSFDDDVSLWMQPVDNFDMVYKTSLQIASYLHPSTVIDACPQFNVLQHEFATPLSDDKVCHNLYTCRLRKWQNVLSSMTPDEKARLHTSVEAFNSVESVKVVFYFSAPTKTI